VSPAKGGGTQGKRGDLEFGTIAMLPSIAGQRHGDKVAIEDGDTRITYRRLDLLSRRAQQSLMAAGTMPGDKVAIWAPNCWRWIVAALAIHRCGATLVPINTRYKGDEAAFILAKTNARILFTVRDFLGCDYPELLRGTTPAVDPTVILLEGNPEGEELSWEAAIGYADQISVREADDIRAFVKPTTTADVLFTSGTTGEPKGALCSHAQNLRAYRDWADVVGLRADDRYLVVAPFFHAFGYKAGWLAALMVGATVVPQPVFDAKAVLARIGPDRITMLPGPPTLYQAILGDPSLGEHDISSLRLAVTGAAVIPTELIIRMREELGFETVVTGYGLTEACGIATMCRAGDPPELIASTSGRAIPGVQVRIVGKSGNKLAAGEPGEVVVRGYNVMKGYLGDADATARAVSKSGWLHTGDIGVMDAGGNLRITDRLKDMFIMGGFNCYPAEIERVLLSRHDIVQAAVIGVPDERMGEVGIAFVVPRADVSIDDAEVVSWCREKMANFKVPRQVRVVQSLPMNATGKVQKFKLRAEVAGV
jgi:HIP---CoA ligase